MTKEIVKTVCQLIMHVYLFQHVVQSVLVYVVRKAAHAGLSQAWRVHVVYVVTTGVTPSRVTGN